MKSANPLRDWKVILLLILGVIAIIWAATREQFDKDKYWTGCLEDSIKVKIKKIYTDSLTHVEMKTMKRPRVRLEASCKCTVHYKKKDVLWIKKPE